MKASGYSTRSLLLVTGCLAGMVGSGVFAGEKIDFSKPTAKPVVKPLTDRDLGREFNFQRRDIAPSTGASIESSLPSPEYLQSQAIQLQEFLQRSAGIANLLEDTGAPGEESLAEQSLRGGIGLEDLYERHAATGGRRRPGSGPDNNSFSRAPGSEGGNEDRLRQDRQQQGTTPGATRNDRNGTSRSDSFIPTDAERNEAERRSTLDRELSGASDNYLAGRTPGIGRSSISAFSGSRENSEFRARMESRNEFQQILRGTSGLDTGLSSSSAARAGGGLGMSPGLGTATPTASAARSTLPDLSESATSAAINDPLAATRNLSLQGRATEWNSGLGRAAGPGLGERTAPAPALKPMELFQRKHDTKAPSRAF